MDELQRRELRQRIDAEKRARLSQGRARVSAGYVNANRRDQKAARKHLTQRCKIILGPFSSRPGEACGRPADATEVCPLHQRYT